jgi:penicillin-binding protein 1C
MTGLLVRLRFRRLGLTLLGCFLLIVLFFLSPLVPLPPDLTSPQIGPITFLDRQGREIAQIASLQARAQQPIPLAQMGEWLPRFTVALEDRRFPDHRGVDWITLGGSLWRNLRSFRIVSGGSTITQQVVKLASGRVDRGLGSKVYEVFAGLRLEREWTKDRILEEYLNRLHYSNRLVGVQAAARAYFNKNPLELTPPEALFLAGLPQAPSRFNPWQNPSAALQRYQRAVRLLQKNGLITAAQEERWLASPPSVGRFLPARQAPHFIDAVMRLQPHLRGSVSTTLDLDLQRQAESLVAAQAAQIASRQARDLALVVLDNETGAVRALVGSTRYDAPRGQINGALIWRSAGSTLKPFIYLAALERKIVTAATVLPDTAEAIREAYQDYDPENYNKRFLGPVRVREALACSLNVPAVLSVEKLGAREAFAELQKWNIGTLHPYDAYGAGFILGNAEVRLLDLTAAYAGLARGGVARPFHLLNQDPAPVSIAAAPEAVSLLNDILCDPLARQRTFGRQSPLETGARFPVKTGTSSGFRDAWCIGFTREHTIGVWAGNFDGQPMKELAAVHAAAPLWRAALELLRSTDHEIPPPSPPLSSTSICALSGLKPVARSTVISEYFLPGTAPTTDAAAFFADLAGGVQVLLPDEYAGWCQSRWNFLEARVQPKTVLEILQPKNNAVFALSSRLSAEQQMLEFKSNHDGRAALTWKINGLPLPISAGRGFL